jgi:menaquinone-dependent protoporphyrinogen IX oxidase
MRVLITWGSKRGGTEGIARSLGESLRAQGLDVDAGEVMSISVPRPSGLQSRPSGA